MKNRISLLLSGIVLFCSGCSGVIDIQPENAATFTNYFQSKQDAEGLLRSLQTALRQAVATDVTAPHHAVAVYGDRFNGTEFKSAKDMELLSHRKANWADIYVVINAADLILDNLHRFPLSSEELKPYELQACFAKAVSYFWLAQRWGSAPITKGTTYFGTLGKSSVEEVLAEAAKWGEKAMELPVFEELLDHAGKPRTTKQFASKGAAAALMAHLYAWRAAIEEKPEYWVEAEKYCTLIIDQKAGHYALAADPETVCTKVLHRESEEGIWEILHGIEEMIGTKLCFEQDKALLFPIRTEGRFAPKITYPIEILKTTINAMYDKEDRRRDAYFWGLDVDKFTVVSFNGKETVYDNTKIDKAFIQKIRHPFYKQKELNREPVFEGYDANKIYWRLADIILLRAECRMRQGKADAEDDLNEIRRRAYGNYDHNYDPSEGSLQDAILEERNKELIFEGHRYYDLVRNGLEYLKKGIGKQKDGSEYNYYYLTEQDVEEGALYYPVPDGAFKNNDLMRQNVYWNRQMQ